MSGAGTSLGDDRAALRVGPAERVASLGPGGHASALGLTRWGTERALR
jgi:hypothetical protein